MDQNFRAIQALNCGAWGNHKSGNELPKKFLDFIILPTACYSADQSLINLKFVQDLSSLLGRMFVQLCFESK